MTLLICNLVRQNLKEMVELCKRISKTDVGKCYQVKNKLKFSPETETHTVSGSTELSMNDMPDLGQGRLMVVFKRKTFLAWWNPGSCIGFRHSHVNHGQGCVLSVLTDIICSGD